MKEMGRSEHSGAVVKPKSSSGCLIIKEKTAYVVEGVGGFSDSSSRSLFNSTKGKKRPRVVLSDSESSDELSEPPRWKVDKFHNGSVNYKRGLMENKEFQTEKRVNNGVDMLGSDESDESDGRKIMKDVNGDRRSLKLCRRSEDQRKSGSGGSRMVFDKKRDLCSENKSIVLGAKNGGYAMEDDELHLPHSASNENYEEDVDEPVRLQGKNGVLKVTVNKQRLTGRSNDHAEARDWKEPRPGVHTQKKLSLSRNNSDQWDAEDRQGLMSGDANKKKAVMSSLFSDLKHPGKPIVSKSKEEGKLKLQKPMLVVSAKETDDSDTSLLFKSSGMRPSSTVEVVKKDGTINPQTKNVTSMKGKESKVKRASCSEKQLLREKIKNMLLGAGWTIDYRPRRNRDYLDSVYINPTGTAYWSITKAYEALQKEEEDSSKAGEDFTPLTNEILSKLTRQTRKKIEREMKKNRRHEGNSGKARKARVKKSARRVASDQHEEKLSPCMRHSHKSSESRLEESSEDSGDYSSDTFGKETPKNDGAAKTTIHANSHIVHGRSRKNGSCTLLVRGSDKELNSENNGFVMYSGKRTLLSWLIDSGTVCVGEKVQYMNLRKTREMQEGWITKDGIHCGCCSKILTILKFELHAGSKLGKPFQNIFIQSGQSLMQCQIDAWNKQEDSERKGFHAVDVDGDPNDDTCGLCGDGGDLICCDGCPSTFHLSCLDMQMLPQGDWHCPNCACKYCERVGGHCSKASHRTEDSFLTCRLCEKKYHKSCSPEMDDKATDSNNLKLSFCGQKCQELYSHLQKLLWIKHELDSGFSWSLIHRSDPLPDFSSVKYSQRVECNSKLAIALSVMDECFLPIVDGRSGINLIHNVVYSCGSNFSRLNYGGFFIAILERGDELICAASIRIHGTQVAEMPFIGTRHIYRRQGMCRRLFHAIESALSILEVEKLVIPAIAEHMHTWTNAFGFSTLEESHKQEMKSMNMLVFPGTDMLQKAVVKQGGLTSDKGKKGFVEVQDCNKPLAKKSELNNTTMQNDAQSETMFSGKKPDAQSDINVAKDTVQDGNETTEESAGADSGSKVETVYLRNGNGIDDGNLLQHQAPDGTLHDTVSLIISCEPQTSTPSEGENGNENNLL